MAQDPRQVGVKHEDQKPGGRSRHRLRMAVEGKTLVIVSLADQRPFSEFPGRRKRRSRNERLEGKFKLGPPCVLG